MDQQEAKQSEEPKALGEEELDQASAGGEGQGEAAKSALDPAFVRRLHHTAI